MLSWGGENVCCANYTSGNPRLKAILTLTEKTGPDYELSAICTIVGRKPCITGPEQYERQ